MRYSCLAAGLAAAVGVLSAASGANAQTCAFTGTTIYAAGSTAQQPYVAVLSQIFLAQTPPVNLVYQGIASCAGVEAITTSTAQTSSITSWTAPATAGAPPVATTCTPSTPVTIDVGVSDVYATTCVGATVPATQKEFFGPIQAMTMVVNPNSNQSVISEEAAHVVFKDIGITSFTVSPWTSATDIWIRPGGENGSGTRFMIANALGMIDTDWSTDLVNDTGGSGSVLTGVAEDTAHANASLGILSVTNTDANRVGSSSTTIVKELAFQAKGQSCGYLPDSSATTFDKLNVREGRYVIWGPGHYITAVTGGVPMSSSAPTSAADAAVQ